MMKLPENKYEIFFIINVSIIAFIVLFKIIKYDAMEKYSICARDGGCFRAESYQKTDDGLVLHFDGKTTTIVGDYTITSKGK